MCEQKERANTLTWVCHFLLLWIRLIRQWCTALSQADTPNVGIINNYWVIDRKKGVAIYLLFSLNFVCHDVLNLFDMLTARWLSYAADGWSQLDAHIPTPRSCIMPCADAVAVWARFPSVTWANRNQSITVTWGLAQQIAARLYYLPISICS